MARATRAGDSGKARRWRMSTLAATALAGFAATGVLAPGCSSGSAGPETEPDATPASDAARQADGSDEPQPADAVAPDSFLEPSPDGNTCVLAENDAGTCNAFDAAGPLIAATCSSATAPQPQGGTIEDGTYVLDSYVHYGGCPTSPDVASTTWVLCGNRWGVAQIVPANADDPDAGTLPVLRLNFTAAVKGSTVDYTLVCQNELANDLSPRGYTASGGHLTFIYADPTVPGATEVSDYLRQ